MAITYSLIASNTLGASAASVTFSSIPNTYTDLVLRVSARNSGTGTWYKINFNSDTATNYSETYLTVFGGSVNSGRISNSTAAFNSGSTYISCSSDTANTFGISEIYIPNYTVAQNKPISAYSARESNWADVWMSALADLWRNNATISTILISSQGTSFVSGSSFFLYGIKKD